MRGHLFCWSHQMELELVELANQPTTDLYVDVPTGQDFIWVCTHGSIMGDCYLAEAGEFPGLGLSPWETRTEMSGLTINLN